MAASDGRPAVGAHPRVAAALGPGTVWSAVHHLAEVTSSNDVALSRLREGEEPGFVVVADRQTRGRGRAGRGWEDGPSDDASLMLTATVRAPAGERSLAPLAAGLAVVDAAAELGVAVELKWPNDVLAAGRKCVGILVEQHRLPEGDVLLVGLGVDVDWRGEQRAGDRAGWTSLAEVAAHAVDRFALLGAILDALSRRMSAVADDPAGLLADYRRRCVTLGQQVRAQGAGGAVIAGRAVDVDHVGRLIVDTVDGPVAVAAGDVTHVRPAP